MFRFRLQRILDLREKREQAVAGRLAEARDREERAREAAQRLEQEREAGARSAAGAQALRLNAGQLQNLRFVVDQMGDHLRFAHQAADAASQTVAKELVEYTAAFRDRKVLDRLRDRHLDGWRTAEVQADRQLMDDIALARFVRKGGAAGGEK